MLSRSATTVRLFSTSTSQRQSLYAFKKQLDEYVYANNLSSQWKSLVYRPRNADTLVSLNALDKKNDPILPRKYPGVPSKKKLNKFIELLLTPKEVMLLRETLTELFKIRLNKSKQIKYLDQSTINTFLYKSYQMDVSLFQQNLMWLDQINENDSVFGVKNVECIAFIRAMILRNNAALDYNSFKEKMSHWVKKANMNDKGSILYNAVAVIASNGTDSTALRNLSELTEEKVYSVMPTADFHQYDHCYSILSALKEVSAAHEISSRYESFMRDVENLKGEKKSTYELLLEANEKFKQAEQNKNLEESELQN